MNDERELVAPPAEQPREAEPESTLTATAAVEPAPPTAAAPAAAAEIIVELPPRREGESPIALAVPDEEAATAVRRLVRGFMRREDLHRRLAGLEGRAQTLEVIERHLDLDPVGFILDRVKSEFHAPLAKQLLADPAVFRDVWPDVEAWLDETVRAQRRAELADEREDTRREADAELARITQEQRERTVAAADTESPETSREPPPPPRVIRARRVA